MPQGKDEFVVSETTGHLAQEKEQKSLHTLHSCFTNSSLLNEAFGKNRIVTWVSCALGEETLTLDDADVVREHGVPQRLLVKHVRTEINNEEMFLTMPMAIILVIVYAVSLAYHDGATTVRDMEDAITFDIKENANFAFSAPGAMGHKGIDDAHSIADVHSWLRLGLRPLIFKQEFGYSEDFGLEEQSAKALAPQSRGSYLQYNRLVGGVVLEQARAETTECRQPDVANSLNMVCSPTKEATDMDTLNLEPNHFVVSQSEPQYNPDLKRWFLIHESTDELDQRFQQLELSEWIDKSTAQVTASFMTYNAHFDTLTMTRVHFYFARSGHIWKKITHTSTYLQLYQSKRVLVADIFFVAIILWLMFSEFKEAAKKVSIGYLSGSGAWDTLKDYVDIWNVIDWVSIGGAIALGCICILYGQEIGNLQSELVDVSEVAGNVNPVEWTFVWARTTFCPLLESLIETFTTVHMLYGRLSIVASLYPVVLVLRLFKAFQAQPRLSIVTRTLMQCSTDVAHFTVVFGAVFCCLAIMGMALFGREIEDFCTFSRAFTTCFVILMGDFDVNAMYEVGRPMATLWFSVFMIMVLLIMLNMLLAIIMDAYSEVKANVQNSDTLCFHIFTFWRRWRELRAGERVHLSHVYRQLMSVWTHRNLEALDTLGLQVEWEHNEIMHLEDFMRHVSGLQETQAQRLMENAVRAWRMTNESALTLSEVLSATGNMIVSMNRTLSDKSDKISRNVEDMRQAMASLPEFSNRERNPTAQGPKFDVTDGMDPAGEKKFKVPEASFLCSPNAPHQPPPEDISERLSAMEARFTRMENAIDKLTSVLAASQPFNEPVTPRGAIASRSAIAFEERQTSSSICSSCRTVTASDPSNPAGRHIQERQIQVDSLPSSSSVLTRGCCGQDLRQGISVGIDVEGPDTSPDRAPDTLN
jgi:hypothetical protein